jgi:CotH kinase protein/Lamin Tail Domain/Secretion system C-terminal sorting domain
MLKILFFIFINFCLVSTSPLSAQTFTDSNLPIVLITTDNGATIPNEPKIGGDLKIIYRGEGQRNYLTDESNSSFLNYNGRIGIEVRGNTSATNPQKPYGFETRLADNSTSNNVSILGMPSENDWILLATFQDKSLIRDYLAYDLARSIGMYASRGKYVEVLLNGEYIGVYILEEKLKRDKNRVDITELLISEETSPEITGGYLLQEDDGGVITNPHPNNTANNLLTIEEPEIGTTSMINYLQNFFNNLDSVTEQPNLANLENGYPSLIDTYSFYNYFMINEYFNNTDAYSRSTFYHKDRNGKLVFGPVWDFNLAAGNSKQTGATVPDHWELKTGYFRGPTFLNRIFDEPTFRCHFAKRWQLLRLPNMPLNTTRVNEKIDSIANTLAEAQVRHFDKWPILGTCSYLDPPGCATRLTYQAEVDHFKQFLAAKGAWIDANILAGYSNCIYPTTPNLVINEIMYDPLFVQTSFVPSFREEENTPKSLNKIAAATAEAEDFEFIEIKNNELTAVDLTGIYFRGGGIVYQFPANSSLPAGAIIVIASNASSFQARYGFAPFGQFTRDLSNTGEPVILADGMGNEIDFVKYSNQSPWPNAYAKSIELKTSTLDNTLPENWFQQTVNGGSPGVENIFVAPDPCLVPKNVIINEINYNSLSSSNSGDWVEIYNSEPTSVDISNWQLKDSENTFLIPDGTILPANGYLVICDVPVNFAGLNPAVTNYINISMDFGLGNSGEIVQLLDENSCLIDGLTYDDAAPWPTSPDGQGYTLSLKQPNLDNSLGINWASSTALLGTPGALNFPANALPVRIVSIEGKELENQNAVAWKVAEELNIEKYEIEYSFNAKSFLKIGEILAANTENYTFLHEKNESEISYYRLKIIEKDGKTNYSKVIAISQTKNNLLKVYPNPVAESISIELVNNTFAVEIFDTKGKNIFKIGNIANKTSISTKDIPNGIYYVKVRSVDGKFNISKKVSVMK